MRTIISKLLGIFGIIVIFSCTQPSKMQNEKTYLAIGTYTEDLGWVVGKGEGFYIYSFNPDSGTLTYECTSPYIANPIYVAVNPDKKIIYAGSQTFKTDKVDFGRVETYKYHSDSNIIERINSVSSMGISPVYLGFNKDLSYAFVANYGGGIAFLPVKENIVDEATSYLYHEGKSTHWRQEASHPHMIEPINDSLIYVSDLGTNKLYVYKIVQNELKLQKEVVLANAESGPRYFVVSNEHNLVYILNELNSTVEVLNTNTFEQVQLVPALDTVNYKAGGSADIKIHPSGKFMYTCTRGDANVISLFSINDNGSIQLVSTLPSKGKTPRSFVFGPNGKFLIVANQNSDNIVVFKINTETGELTETGVDIEVPSPTCVQLF